MAIDRIRVNEGSSSSVTFTLKDNLGVVIPLANLSVAELTLFDLLTYAPLASPIRGIINDRDSQDVRNTNDVTVHVTSGLVSWAVQPEDTIIVASRRQIERHRARFRFVASGAELDYQIEMEIVNMRDTA